MIFLNFAECSFYYLTGTFRPDFLKDPNKAATCTYAQELQISPVLYPHNWRIFTADVYNSFKRRITWDY